MSALSDGRHVGNGIIIRGRYFNLIVGVGYYLCPYLLVLKNTLFYEFANYFEVFYVFKKKVYKIIYSSHGRYLCKYSNIMYCIGMYYYSPEKLHFLHPIIWYAYTVYLYVEDPI
uniref:Uncharacterized protein n=1 Tax=Cacopsylla melanoneura TaxID=428564 RepID=A0A8D9AIK7_9HEMI